jgi:hypothetical protein
MATGFPVKANYATGDVLTAANMNDLAGTLNYLDPTAKGDLFPASDGSTLTRLAVGSNGQILTADSTQTTGMKWAAATGKIIQIVNATYSTEQGISTTTYTDTNLTATITPTASTSTILVLISMPYRKNNATTNNGVNFKVLRGATAIWTGTQFGFTGSTINNFGQFSLNYVDSPATTSATTYKLQAAASEAGGTAYVPVNGNPATIQLIEIGA